MPEINDSLTLPCGVELKNRIVKAAMTEGLADEYNRATDASCNLYTAWSKGGSGMLITGNVQVDRRYMERPRNVAIDGPQSEEQLERLRKWAKASQLEGTKIFVQVGHAGRQSNKLVNLDLVGPSAILLKDPMPGNPPGTVRALSLEEIEDVQNRFVYACQVCKDTGFDGVQLHAAHGYLLSSFLNPLANQREDQYGGCLENRARLLLDTVKVIREKLGPEFPISVKINSADFQKGGFSAEDCQQVVEWLDQSGVDIIEISGGNYESPAMLVTKSNERPQGADEIIAKDQASKNKSTIAREAYFLEFTDMIRKNIKTAKVMVTGGFRSKVAMNEALQRGDCDLIGVGRPLGVELDCVKSLLNGEKEELPRVEDTLTLPWYFLPLSPFHFYNVLQFVAVLNHIYLTFYAVGANEPLPEYSHVWGANEIKKRMENNAATLKGLDCVGVCLNKQ